MQLLIRHQTLCYCMIHLRSVSLLPPVLKLWPLRLLILFLVLLISNHLPTGRYWMIFSGSWLVVSFNSDGNYLLTCCTFWLTSFQWSTLLIWSLSLQRGTLFMSSYFPDYVNHNIRLWTYWAHLEAKLLKDITAARGVWENLIKTQ